MRLISDSFILVWAYRRQLFTLNASFLFFSLIGLCLYASFLPEVQADARAQISRRFHDRPLVIALDQASADGRIALPTGIIFANNLLLGPIVTITLPSLIVPFAGVLIGGFQSFYTGFALAALNRGVEWPLPGLPLLIPAALEAEASIIAMVAALVQGRAWCFPSTVGQQSRRGGYVCGLLITLRIYPAVAILLAASATYEVAIVALSRLPV